MDEINKFILMLWHNLLGIQFYIYFYILLQEVFNENLVIVRKFKSIKNKKDF